MRRREDAPCATSDICGVEVANLTEAEAISFIDRLVGETGPHYAAVVNAAKIVAANEDGELKRALLEADLVTADGMSIVWASRVLGQPLKQRVTGIDLFERLVERAAERGWSVYFLGAREESVLGVVSRLSREIPNLRVAGYRNGYFAADESQYIAQSIRLSNADLLFVAIGSPGQEFWIVEHLKETGVSFALGVGGSFDHLSGLVPRAPEWMQRSGLEWLHRLIHEPRRLWKRYLVGNLAFIWLLAKQLASRPRLR
jgi:N-acetylglucosaminyldiphosphoundecaprenol N-acetyl-beta-D-mannosaminyltransferase